MRENKCLTSRAPYKGEKPADLTRLREIESAHVPFRPALLGHLALARGHAGRRRPIHATLPCRARASATAPPLGTPLHFQAPRSRRRILHPRRGRQAYPGPARIGKV